MVSTAELKAFIKEQGTIGEEQIARRFLTTAPVIAMMCERLAAKGDVRLIATANTAAARISARAAPT